MTETPEPTFDQVLALARRLALADQLRLAAALSQTPAPPHPGVPGLPVRDPLAFDEGPDEQPERRLVPNGLHPSGQPLLRLTGSAVQRMALAGLEREQRQLPLYRARMQQGEAHLGLVYGYDPRRLDSAGWALVVSSADDAALIAALVPLLQHRSQEQGLPLPPLNFRQGESCGAWLRRHVPDPNQALRGNPRLPVLLYEPGETASGWLARHGLMMSAVDPRRGVPFYLLLAARPGALHGQDRAPIPFAFQSDLDIFWGVGRVCFTDERGLHDLSGYRTYAEQVVAWEQQPRTLRSKQIVYFATRHLLDVATERSTDELIRPLIESPQDRPTLAQRNGFTQRLLLGSEAQRGHLERMLRGQDACERPALLLSATHGIGLPSDDTRLLAEQGALVCQDWDGCGPIRREHWFAAANLPDQTDLRGLIAVLFACYGGGCPSEDGALLRADQQSQIVAPFAFVAKLPQQLLRCGALAVVGHVDRAWTYAFSDPRGRVRAQSQAFEDLLARIMAGERMGFATDQFNIQQAALAVHLNALLISYRHAQQHAPLFKQREIVALWTAYQDARNYMLLGDPAVRLRFDPASTPQT